MKTTSGARFSLALAISVAIAMAILGSLGTWQLQRLAWKNDLLARIAALKDAPPEPAQVVLRRLPEGLSADYLRVELDCPAVETTPTLRLYALQEGQTGDRLITACTVDAAPYRTLLVDRGFIADGAKPTPGKPLSGPLIGVLRQGDKPGTFTPAPSQGRWYGRDVPAMAKALGAAAPAPLFLMLESPAPAGVPTPSALPTDIPNRHFEYALTWFGLALALLAVYIAKLVRDRPRNQ